VAHAAQIIVRAALYIDLMLLLGLPFFALGAVPRFAPEAAPGGETIVLRRFVVVAGLAGLALSSFHIVLVVAAMSGTTLAAVEAGNIGVVITNTMVGAAWLVQIAALVAVLLASTLRNGTRLVVGSSAVAIASLAWFGHGAMDDNAVGILHIAADIAHLLAAGLWFGALVGLSILVARTIGTPDAARITEAHRALAGFGRTGTMIVAAITATGVINASILIGPARVMALGSSPYGQLLLMKLGLFALMLGFAAKNRFRLTPALAAASIDDEQERALTALRRSLFVETACAIAIFGLVAALGMLEPPSAT
jgi:putative copper resistance protein D